MQNLSPRQVKTEESLRLGVVSGWYSSKVIGTFVSGPHESEADCLRKNRRDQPAAGKRFKSRARHVDRDSDKGDAALTRRHCISREEHSLQEARSNGTHTR